MAGNNKSDTSRYHRYQQRVVKKKIDVGGRRYPAKMNPNACVFVSQHAIVDAILVIVVSVITTTDSRIATAIDRASLSLVRVTSQFSNRTHHQHAPANTLHPVDDCGR